MKLPFTTRLLLPCLLFAGPLFAQKQGLEAIDSLKQELRNAAARDSNWVKTVYYIAYRYSNVNADSSMVYTQIGLTRAKQLNFQKGIAGFYGQLGNLSSDNGDYPKALRYFGAARKINQKIGNKRNETGNIINMASAYQRQGNDLKAMEYNFAALKIAENAGLESLVAVLYGNIANSYFSQQNLELAIRYHQKSYKKYVDLHDQHGIADQINKIGAVYLQQKQYKKAWTYLQKSLALYRSLDEKTGEAIVLSQIALVFEDDKDKKIDYMLQAQRIFDQISPRHANSTTNLGNIGGTFAEIYIQKLLNPNKAYHFIPSDYETIAKNAVGYLDRAIALSKETGDEDNFSYFSGELALLQEKMGDYKSALSNFRIAQQVNDSLYSQESKNKIAALEAQYRFSRKEDQYRQQQQLAAYKIRQVYLFGALLILLICALAVYLLSRSRIGQLRLKNELQRRTAEEKTKELLHLNKLSESELKAIRAQMNPHFIFNVLNSIESYIVENDSRTASRLVQKFASLSRLILENSTQSMVTADREWRALKLYAELETMRFNHQFSCRFEADPEIDLSRLLLPPMLVQPLIENSIHHGIRNAASAENLIVVSLTQTTSAVCFIVEDNGIGLQESEKFKPSFSLRNKSIGLSAIRERIDLINTIYEGSAATFELFSKPAEAGSGTIARITLPKIFKQDQDQAEH